MQVREGQLATAEGVSYLEAKYLLLLHYCMHLVFYVLLKAEGRHVRDHPVIARLVEIRAFLEKARPIDKRLRYQMDKLLAAATLVQVSIKQEQPCSMLVLSLGRNHPRMAGIISHQMNQLRAAGVLCRSALQLQPYGLLWENTAVPHTAEFIC